MTIKCIFDKCKYNIHPLKNAAPGAKVVSQTITITS